MDAIEFRSQEGSEGGEATESMEVRALDSATFEPAACLEGMGDYQQAEAIQTRLTAIVDSLVTQTSEESVVVGAKGEVGDCPIPIPHPAEEIGWKGYRKEPGSVETPLPGTGGETGYKVGEGEVPGEADLASSAGGLAGSGAEKVSITPINLPREADLASSAGGVAGSGAEGVGITPINLPREADLASSSGGVAGSGAEQVGITPINLPREANVVSDAEQSGNNVASGEIKGPGGDGVASGAVKGPGGDGVASGVFTGPGGDGVASAPVPQPVPDVADGSLEGLGAMPDPIPHPEDEIGFKFVTKESGTVEIPLPGTAAEGVVKNEIGWKMGEGKGPAGAVETPLPGITGEGGLTEEAAIEQVVVRTEGVLQEMGVSFNLQT